MEGVTRTIAPDSRSSVRTPSPEQSHAAVKSIVCRVIGAPMVANGLRSTREVDHHRAVVETVYGWACSAEWVPYTKFSSPSSITGGSLPAKKPPRCLRPPAHLLRALLKEGLTYRHLVDRVRFAAARRFLGQDDLTIAEIADRLGYSGANNFGRAFRRLGGITPTQFRRSHKGD